MDDTCLYDSSVKDSFFRACEYLDRCGSNGIMLNPDKSQFAQDTVDFVGYEVGTKYVRPSKKKSTAMGDLRAPEKITDVRAFPTGVTTTDVATYSVHGCSKVAETSGHSY